MTSGVSMPLPHMPLVTPPPSAFSSACCVCVQSFDAQDLDLAEFQRTMAESEARALHELRNVDCVVHALHCQFDARESLNGGQISKCGSIDPHVDMPFK
jgi:hypothetical protein